MLSIYHLDAGTGWGAYNEILVVAESPEEAKAIVLAETDPMYTFFTAKPDEIVVTDWGMPNVKGILYESGDDC